jgi:DNA polymerase III subunit alpha
MSDSLPDPIPDQVDNRAVPEDVELFGDAQVLEQLEQEYAPEHCPGDSGHSTADSAEIANKKYPGPADFVHLHVHTLFSPLDGVAEPKEYAERAKHFGMRALAVTDHGSLGSYPDMYLGCKEAGIKFIPGIEAYLNEHHQKLLELRADPKFKFGELTKNDPDLASRIRRNRHIILLAKNDTGYRNLLHMTTRSWEIGFYYKPRIWLDEIRKHKEGLILLSGCLNGPISHELVRAVEAKRAGDMAAAVFMKKAVDWVRILKDEFADDFYFEIQMPGPELKAGYDVLQLSISLAKKFNVKTVMTGDCHYLHREDFMTQRAMMAIDAGKTINDPDQFIIDTNEGFMKCRAEFRQTWHEQGYSGYATIDDIEKACDTTVDIAEKCQNWKPNLDPKLPAIDDADKKLADLAIGALYKKGLHRDTTKYEIDGVHVTYIEQLKIELERIKSKGFSPYFLITMNLVQYSANIGYPVGPGRGSAGGCLVSYLIGIHEMDPLRWGLSFDRFLSQSRGGNMLITKME